MVGIFLQDDVHGTAHRRTAELGRDHALVDLDPVDHVHRDVVEVQEIGLVVHGGVVQEEADPLPFQAAHGQPGRAADAAGGADGHAHRLGQDALDIAHRSLELLHADDGYRHGLFADHAGLALGGDGRLLQGQGLRFHGNGDMDSLASFDADLSFLGQIAHEFHADRVGAFREVGEGELALHVGDVSLLQFIDKNHGARQRSVLRLVDDDARDAPSGALGRGLDTEKRQGRYQKELILHIRNNAAK